MTHDFIMMDFMEDFMVLLGSLQFSSLIWDVLALIWTFKLWYLIFQLWYEFSRFDMRFSSFGWNFQLYGLKFQFWCSLLGAFYMSKFDSFWCLEYVPHRPYNVLAWLIANCHETRVEYWMVNLKNWRTYCWIFFSLLVKWERVRVEV